MLRVKEIAKTKGMTIKEVAEKIGILAPALSRIANGSNTTIDTLQKIADALGVSIKDLFDDDTDTITCPKCGAKFKLVK